MFSEANLTNADWIQKEHLTGDFYRFHRQKTVREYLVTSLSQLSSDGRVGQLDSQLKWTQFTASHCLHLSGKHEIDETDFNITRDTIEGRESKSIFLSCCCTAKFFVNICLLDLYFRKSDVLPHAWSQ